MLKMNILLSDMKFIGVEAPDALVKKMTGISTGHPQQDDLAAGSGLARASTTSAPVTVALTGLSIEMASATVQSATMGNKLTWQVNGVARRS